MLLSTLGEILRSLFPEGVDLKGDSASEFSGIEDRRALVNSSVAIESMIAPFWPPDLFGAMAYLLHESQGYCRYVPGYEPSKDHSTFGISQARLSQLVECGIEWRDKGPQTPNLTAELWSELLEYKDINLRETASPWVQCALELMIIADEACADLQWHADEGNWISWTLGAAQNDRDRISYMTSITMRLNSSLACVQTKSFTSDVGITIRSFSQNLALLPGRHKVKSSWNARSIEGLYRADYDELSLLLIPAPYELEPSDFVIEANETSKRWSWFEINQTWLNDQAKFETEILATIAEAMEQSSTQSPIVGILFPELSMNYECFDRIRSYVNQQYQQIEFVLAGTSSDPSGTRGNFAVTSQMLTGLRFSNEETGNVERPTITSWRSKHHRWRIDNPQIEGYGLTKLLSEHTYWENIPISKREVIYHNFSKSSIFATLICEDLARVDPCHESLRAIGPNIIFMLLLDGAQLPDRWAPKAAQSMCEDPGSSTLTFTSRGLLDAWAKNSDEPREARWEIACWRDPINGNKLVECPPPKRGSVLKLKKLNKMDITIDGRNKLKELWIYDGHFSI